MKVFFYILIIAFFFNSCKEKTENCKISKNNYLEKSQFINITDRIIIKSVPIGDSTMYLPKTNKYQYLLASNFINNDTIYLKRVDQNKYPKTYNYSIIKINKSFDILDSLILKSDYDFHKVDNIALSPKKEKIAIIYNLKKDSSYLKILNFKNTQVFFEKKFPFKISFNQNSWSLDEKQFVFFNAIHEIYILDIEKSNIERLNIKGSDPLWIHPFSKIAYLESENKIILHDINSKKSKKIFEVKSNMVSSYTILDYYWFQDQNKFYIKGRKEVKGFEKTLWTNKNYILEYICK